MLLSGSQFLDLGAFNQACFSGYFLVRYNSMLSVLSTKKYDLCVEDPFAIPFTSDFTYVHLFFKMCMTS